MEGLQRQHWALKSVHGTTKRFGKKNPRVQPTWNCPGANLLDRQQNQSTGGARWKKRAGGCGLQEEACTTHQETLNALKTEHLSVHGQ